MAIEVKVVCSDCGTVTDKVLKATDTEILCPECRRNMRNLPKEEFKQVEKTLSGQTILGIIALVLFFVGVPALLVLTLGSPGAWVSTDNKDYLARNPREDTTMFLAIAAALGILIVPILGALASRKRFVVEI